MYKPGKIVGVAAHGEIALCLGCGGPSLCGIQD
jgi:hypothetical protein